MAKIDQYTNFQGKIEWRVIGKNNHFELFAMKVEKGFVVNVYLNDQKIVVDKAIDTESEKEALLFAHQQTCEYLEYLQSTLGEISIFIQKGK